MDTTPEYIKMCEKAEEIQGQWSASESHDGDWIFYHRSLGNGTEEICVDIGAGSSADKWLPRQDQLQEMMKEACPIPSALLWEFARWQDNAGFSRYNLKSWEELTFEKLWLGFVMDKKFGKIWNGKEWIKE